MTTNQQFFYFDDKDVFDAIVSEKKKVSSEKILLFLREKGIVMSRNAERNYLCDYIATWFRDYHTLDFLALGAQRAREATKYESEEVSVLNCDEEISVEDIQSAVDRLKTNASSNGQILVSESDGNENITNLVWTRDVVDFSKTPLRQRIRRSDRIQILRTKSGKVNLRTPTDDSCGLLRTQFVRELQNITGQEFTRAQIKLKENASSEERIAFFLNVLNGMPDFVPQTVTAVNLVSDNAETDEEGNDIEAEDQARVDFQGLLQAKLRGGRLLETPEYTDLIDRGFSPSEIRWWATSPDGMALVLFWFGFSNAKEGSGFFCNVVKVRHRSPNNHEILKTQVKPTKDELNRYLSVLEDTVRKIFKKQYVQNETQYATNGVVSRIETDGSSR